MTATGAIGTAAGLVVSLGGGFLSWWCLREFLRGRRR
jgi:hypothetical protein